MTTYSIVSDSGLVEFVQDDEGHFSPFLTTTKFRLSSIVTTNVGHVPPKPDDFVLYQNYPNPFNPRTTIKFVVPTSVGTAITTLKVFDVLGREIATLVNEWKEAGSHSITFDIRPDSAFAEGTFDIVSSGVYFYRMSASNRAGQKDKFVEVKRMVLLR
jgi:hypothetical protein